jgi:hypothetical protein
VVQLDISAGKLESIPSGIGVLEGIGIDSKKAGFIQANCVLFIF